MTLQYKWLMFKRFRLQIRPYCEMLALQYEKSFYYFYFDACLCYLLFGCDAQNYQSYGFWKLKMFERKRYLTTGKLLDNAKKYNDSQYLNIFSNKLNFYNYYKSYIKRKWIYGGDCSVDEIKTFLQTNGCCVVKPTNCSTGVGISKITYAENANIEKEIQKIIKKKMLVEQYVIQHDDLASINPYSTNTIRVYTTNIAGEIHIYRVFLKCASDKKVQDNFGQGGIVAEIDLETGVVKSLGKNKKMDVYLRHPLTNYLFTGFQIPKWNEVIALVKNIAKEIETMRYVGWDVAITNDYVEVIEGNNLADPIFIQVFNEGGCLMDINKILTG
ncbi:hypothetical protein D3C74_200010 [compost metagenome]